MPTAPGVHSRRDKGNDAETVLYEIDLLQFARDHLLAPPSSWTELDEYVYLEDFLLHYRNLIEFFGNPKPRDTDLTIKRPKDFWATNRLPDPKELALMKRPELWKKYDTSKNQHAISKYLHHCTKQRTVKKNWHINDMYEELRPVIDKFQSLLPEYQAATRRPIRTRGVSMLDGNSTTSTRIGDQGLFTEE